MKKVTFKQYKKAYDNFWQPDRKVTPADIRLMVRLIDERTKKHKQIK